MSRIGKKPISLPKGVEVKITGNDLTVKGPKGEIATPVADCLEYAIAEEEITITRKDEEAYTRAQHGLRRTLLANCVLGVTAGFSKVLDIIGVGYKVAVKGNIVELALGFSHPVVVELPQGIEAKSEGTKLTISGVNKERVGEMAARIRRLRKPEPYKGKGIRYENEQVRRKAGKSGGKK